jgi:hypothetical protein
MKIQSEPPMILEKNELSDSESHNDSTSNKKSEESEQAIEEDHSELHSPAKVEQKTPH